ncbi:MAG: peptide/nickel transport system permease protein [Candidatus Krumholzibacteriia bacterium]|jgi:peptide/nickel transport system permease protein
MPVLDQFVRLWRRHAEWRIGAVIAIGGVLLALLAPVIAPSDPAALGGIGERLLPPSGNHWLGTDLLGRDVLSRLIHGARVSLIVGWTSVLAAMLCGTFVGMVAGLGPRWLDRFLMWVTDLFMAFPRIFLVLLLVSLSSPSLILIMLVLGLTGWMSIARLVRAETLSIRERDFVAAAKGLGFSPWRVAIKHILPSLWPTIIVAATLRVGGAILTESFLSYLGLGVQEPTVSWGSMIQMGRANLVDGWWLATFPGLALALTVVGYNLIGDGLRRWLDPRDSFGGSHE